MPTQELIKNQQEATTLVDAKYTVEVSGGGAPVNREKPILEALLPGVRLHFLRYGLFLKSSETDVGYNIAGSIDGGSYSTSEMDASNGNLASTDLFYVAKTSLKKGYLYLFNADNPNDYHELAVDDYGAITPIIWNSKNLQEDGSTPKDQRTANPKSIRYKRIVNKERDNPKKYWIGFSPVQWSYEYHRTMLNASDADKQQANMVLVTCGGLQVGEEEAQEHVSTYQDVKFVHYKEHPNHSKLKQTIRQVNSQEGKETREGNNTTYEDMFITLHDPVGCSEDVGEVLGDKILDLKALTEAIQTGETIEDAKDRIIDGCKPAKIKSDYADLFNLALTCYKMVYNDRNNVKEYDGGAAGGGKFSDSHFPGQPSGISYNTSRGRRIKRPAGWEPHEFYIGNGLDRQKVEGILGVNKRKEYRDIVNVFRNELGNFIKQDYFKKSLHNYTENSDEYCIYGHEKVFTLLLPLFNNPYKIDRHLSLEGDKVGPGFEKYQPDDSWTQWITECMTQESVTDTNDYFQKLLVENKTISQTIIESWIDLSNKLGAALRAKIEIYTAIAFKSKIATSSIGKPLYQKIIKDKAEYIVDKLNKIEITAKKSGQAVKPFHFGNSHNIEMKAYLFGAVVDPNLEYVVKSGGEIIMEGKADSFTHNMLYGKESIAKGGKNAIKIGDQVENIYEADYKVNETAAKRYNEKAAKFLNSRGFSGVLFGLQVINLGNAVIDLSSTKGNSFGEFAKPIVNTVGIAGEFTEAMLNLRKAHLATFELELSVLGSRALYIAGALGGAVTSGMCFWDASIAFGKHDRDKAIALTFAGVAFGVATGVGLITGSTYVAATVAGALTASGVAISGSALALLLGPVGWIALGAGLVFVVLANYFQDSELQFYFKNFLLNDHEAYPIGSLLPMDYSRKILNNKDFLMQSIDEEAKGYLTHPSDAMASLYDITICNGINYKVPSDGFSEKMGSGRSAKYRVYKFAVEMVFNQFLKSGEQLEARGILHHALDNKTDDFLLDNWAKVTSIKQEDGSTKYILQTTLGIPADKIAQIGNSTKLVLALRVSLDNTCTSYYPYPLVEKKERWIGARFGLTRGIVNRTNTSSQEVIFDSFAELRKTSTW